MTAKYNEYLSTKITDEMSNSINQLLEQLPRSDFGSRCDLVRELLSIGLKNMWKKVNKSNAKEVE